MRYPTFHSISGIAVLLAMLLASCDPFKQDLIQDDRQIAINLMATEYYILPNTSAIINLETLVNTSFTALNLKVAEMPARGRIIGLDEFLLKYEPNTSFKNGSDQLKIAMYSNGKLMTSVKVTIHMKDDPADFPCSLYAVEDKVITRSDSSVSIPFLLNDRVCGVDLSKVTVSVYTTPKHGQATLSGNEMIYMPTSSFEGNDTLVYKITTSDDSSDVKGVQSYGIIIVTTINCKMVLSDSYVLDLTDAKSNSISAGECAGAYEILNVWNYNTTCLNEPSFSVIVLSETRHSGSVCIGSGGSITYYTNQKEIPKSDTIRLEVCHNGVCKVISVYVKREPKTVGRWSIVTNDIPDARSIYFKTRSIGFVAGDNFMLKKTTDGGATWQALPIGNLFGLLVPGSIYDLQFLNDSFGYGRVVLNGNASGWISTKDGGSTWVFKPFSEAMTSIRFVSPDVGFIGAKNYGTTESHLFKTMDGGNTWELKLRLTNAVADIKFLSEEEGFISASNEDFESLIYKTINAGENWVVISAIPYELLTVNHESLYAVRSPLFGESSASILKSTDKVNWSEVFQNKTHYLRHLSFSPEGSLGIAIGEYMDGQGWSPVAVISHDGGVTWTSEHLSFGLSYASRLWQVTIPESNVAYVLYGVEQEVNLLKYEK